MSAIAHPGGAGLPDDNRGPNILAAVSITTGAALVVVLTRLYVRIFMVKNIGLDDCFMALTMALSLSGWAVIIPEVRNGAGRHRVYLDQEVAVTGLHLNFVTQAIYLWAIGLVKISIGLFLIRFVPNKSYKIFIWTVIAMMAIYTTICFFTLIFQCKDMASIWDDRVKSQCFTPRQLIELSYTNTALNILTDLTFAVLPAFMLRKLQINMRTKASLICILGLGVFACVAAFVKLSFLPNYGKTGDFLWDSTDLTIWITTECNTGIVAGSLPCLKPLFKRLLNNYSSGSRSRGHFYNKYDKGTKLRSLSRNTNKNTPSSGAVLQSGLEYTAHNVMSTKLSHVKHSITSVSDIHSNNSSEERILPIHSGNCGGHGSGGIVRTTEVQITSTTDNSDHNSKAWSNDNSSHVAWGNGDTTKKYDVEDRV
ncbi:conserved hypothetical protein [Talaromyces stipitatus ATCC 10500]|uniref:Rhodopsin domain-containing protein n=1 Tax=Talaromyces stipitatus (strain ATCC 10500 / CBS 375.48 / QM 6759 / NRRL 1006) TaxID=441959 RepID=B8MG03_TALSN|nr:uncharacterized protein TSTA_009880 [Talaromyces stipitatus ATCC 10500]EED15870.1 conserved hypothetical protein [Talaromyces stipitatus ATCC 10500]